MATLLSNDGSNTNNINVYPTNGSQSLSTRDGVNVVRFTKSLPNTWNEFGWAIDPSSPIEAAEGQVAYMQFWFSMPALPSANFTMETHTTQTLAVADTKPQVYFETGVNARGNQTGNTPSNDLSVLYGADHEFWLDMKIEMVAQTTYIGPQFYLRASDTGNLGIANFDPDYDTWNQVGTLTASADDFTGSNFYFGWNLYQGNMVFDLSMFAITDDGTLTVESTEEPKRINPGVRARMVRGRF